MELKTLGIKQGACQDAQSVIFMGFRDKKASEGYLTILLKMAGLVR
jgi:hypothetical protein